MEFKENQYKMLHETEKVAEIMDYPQIMTLTG